MTDNKNTILAIVLSAIVLIGWQYFFAMPQEKARQEQLQAQQQQQQLAKQAAPQATQPGQPGAAPQVGTAPGTAQVPGAAPAAAPAASRADALKASPRVPITTDSLQGSIALKGARIDDLALIKFRETVDPKSPPIVLLSPSGTADPFYAEWGWTNAAGANVKVPTADTVWTQAGSGALSVGASGDADLGQRRGPRIPPHHRGRRQVPLHRQGRSDEQGHEPGLALSLRADLAPRHAADRRLLHPA